MHPTWLEGSFQARFLIPMGISVAAGLMFATVLTLLAVPSMYLIVLDMKAILARAGGWLLGRSPTLPEQENVSGSLLRILSQRGRRTMPNRRRSNKSS